MDKIAPRIITGLYKGKHLKVPESARPVTDRVKTVIFDLLGDVEGLTCIDLFAGSGNLGIEALSRGVIHSTFVESSVDSVKLIRENITSLGIQENSTLIINAKVEKFLTETDTTYDLIFIDPPFERIGQFNLEPVVKLMHTDSVIILKIHNVMPKLTPELAIIKEKKMGENVVVFIKRL